MLDGELFMLGEIRGAFISDGAWSLRGWNGMFPPHGSRKRFGCGMLGHTCTMRKP
jgi:hypothetical protein